MRKSDKTILLIVVFLFCFVWLAYFLRSIALGIFVSVLLTILFERLFAHFYARKQLTKSITVEQMESSFALMGISRQLEYLINRVPPYFEPISDSKSIVFTKNLEKIAVFPNLKFSATSADEVAKFYQSAKEREVKEIWILSKAPSRDLLLFCSNLDIKITFIPSKSLHSFLKKQNALPTALSLDKKRIKRPYKETLKSIFTRPRAKYFLLSGGGLCLLSLLSPLKIYYLAMGSISLILCFICLLLPNTD